MATLTFLPATTYVPPSPALARNGRRSLNTIMEDDENSVRGRRPRQQSQRNLDYPKKPTVVLTNNNNKAGRPSPLSDHFPTPRGTNFMSAPVPASPSSISTESQVSSAPWSRDSFSTDDTEFDDIYGVSDDEIEHRKSRTAASLTGRSSVRRQSTSSVKSNTSLPTLVIPSGDHWPGVSSFKVLSTPIPPTPPPKLPMSPAIYSYLTNKEVPSPTAPPSLDGSSASPSLDGSLTSDQLDKMSAPPTPDVGNDEDTGDTWGHGVQLQPAAMATLRALSGDEDDYLDQQIEQLIELSQMPPDVEMQQSPPPLVTNIRRHDSIVLTPAQQRAMQSLTKLDIPSPGGFFASLTPGTRHTWHMVTASPQSAHPPSSATAEHFYKTPWMSQPIERIVEVSESMSDGAPTARPNLKQLNSDLTVKRQDSDDTVTQLPRDILSPLDEGIVATEILTDYSSTYVRGLIDGASENLDRTGLWLSAQSDYLSALINPPEERDDEDALLKRQSTVVIRRQESVKKTVRFSEVDIACPKPPRAKSLESAYYRSFQTIVNQSRYRDTFVHRVPRFESLQSQRVSFPEAHRNQLLGKYQLSVVPLSVKKRMSANVARGDEQTPEDPARLKRDREREAIRQMSGPTWNVMASKVLNGGRLIAAPVAKRLARLSSMGPTTTGVPRDRARILDLGGQATCDWAWHCATEYPNTKVYTVTTKAIRQLSNSNIRGPANHRQVAVEKLWLLPFKDNSFDLISARYLYTILKVASEHGIDEYEACLDECYRILKPGGYLEFNLFDSDIVNPGPLCQAMSVEFGFSLRTRGYDAQPTKAWLGRLRDTGFTNIKRAWLFLPMGSPTGKSERSERDSWGVERNLELEAMVMGSTEGVSSITGVVGSWAWEKWMLGLQVECGKEEESLLGGVHSVLEEGRTCGAGWRTLNGWARKPSK